MPKAIRIYETGGPDVMRWESYALSEAAQAHRDLESRKTTGVRPC